MLYTTRICDLCNQDGEIVLAVASYYSEETYGFYDVCLKHLEDVKRVGIEFQMFEDE